MARDPEKQREANRRYREKNREALREWGRQYNQTAHRQERHKAGYENLKADPEKWAAKLAKDKILNRMKRDETRKALIELLGGKCSICDFSDWRALQVDHVNGNGNQERKQARSMGYYYRQILESGGEGYQLLCANCNQIKRYENGEGYIVDR